MRPRFVIELPCSTDRVMQALRSDESRAERRVEGHFSTRHGVLMVRASERQFWSTQLSLTIEDARFGPQREPMTVRESSQL